MRGDLPPDPKGTSLTHFVTILLQFQYPTANTQIQCPRGDLLRALRAICRGSSCVSPWLLEIPCWILGVQEPLKLVPFTPDPRCFIVSLYLSRAVHFLERVIPPDPPGLPRGASGWSATTCPPRQKIPRPCGGEFQAERLPGTPHHPIPARRLWRGVLHFPSLRATSGLHPQASATDVG